MFMATWFGLDTIFREEEVGEEFQTSLWMFGMSWYTFGILHPRDRI